MTSTDGNQPSHTEALGWRLDLQRQISVSRWDNKVVNEIESQSNDAETLQLCSDLSVTEHTHTHTPTLNPS